MQTPVNLQEKYRLFYKCIGLKSQKLYSKNSDCSNSNICSVYEHKMLRLLPSEPSGIRDFGGIGFSHVAGNLLSKPFI